MTTEKKTTKREYFEMLTNLQEVKANDALYKFCLHEMVLLDKKKSAERKPTKQQQENDGIVQEIYEILLEQKDDMLTIAELQQASASLSEVSAARMSALIKKLVDAGKVEKEKNKSGRMMYKAKEEE